ARAAEAHASVRTHNRSVPGANLRSLPDATPDPSPFWPLYNHGNAAATARTPGAVLTSLRTSATLVLRQPVSDGVCLACSRNPAQRCGKPNTTIATIATGISASAAIGANGN